MYGVVPKMGFSVEETKELYHVKVVSSFPFYNNCCLLFHFEKFEVWFMVL